MDNMETIQKYNLAHTTPKPNRDIRYIVIHYTAGITAHSGAWDNSHFTETTISQFFDV